MNFQWPLVLLALPLVLAALLALFAVSRRARARLLGQFAAARLLPALLVNYSPGLRRLKQGLLTSGVLLVVLALARPQWGHDWEVQRARGVDVMFVIDTSKSMLTEDVPPHRLERAKLAIMDLVEKMPGDRVGLVAFAGQAFVQCPLTLDYDAFRQCLEAVDTNTITRGGTNIAAGIDEAASALEESGNHKIMVLVTDGEDLEGQGIAAAKALRGQGVTIYTVGVGTSAGDIIPIRGKDGQVDFVRDENGNIVKSHLDAATLTAIAQATGGFYQPLGPAEEGLNQIYDAGIKTIPETTVTSRMQRQAIERFQWPLTVALFLLALEPLLGTRRPSWWQRAAPVNETVSVSPAAKTAKASAATAVAAGLVVLALWFFSAPHAAADDDVLGNVSAPPAPPSVSATSAPATAGPTGNATAASGIPPSVAQQLFAAGNYRAAAQAYASAADAAPQDARLRYDEGASYYRSGQFDRAAQAFEQAMSASDLALQQQSSYNLGNARYRLGQSDLQQDPQKTVSTWEDALKDYQNATDLNPNDSDARYNRDLLQKEIEELKKEIKQQQQQQQQQQNQQQQNQQSPQNQQNQQQQSSSQNQQQQNQSSQNQNQNNSQNQQQQSSQQQNRGQQQQSSQNQNGSQNQQPNQNGNQGQQSQQNQGQGQQQQNQSGSQSQQSQGQGQQQQNQSGGQNQQQNQNGSQNQTGQGQQQNQNQGQNQSGNQNQQQPGPGQQSQNQSGREGQQPQQNQNGNQNQGQGQQQKQNLAQNQSGGQGQPPQNQNGSQNQARNGNPSGNNQANSAGNQTAANNHAGTEPAGAKAGQPQAQAAAAAADGNTTNPGDTAGAVAANGVMTREEARQVLDSLKMSERKLPASNYDAQKEGANTDQFKDW
jgi:Ca-activated chloride channel family protein